MDPPAHMRQRSMVEPLFVAEHVETMKPYIQRTVDQLLDQMVARGCEEPVDLIENFALPVPSYVSKPALFISKLALFVKAGFTELT